MAQYWVQISSLPVSINYPLKSQLYIPIDTTMMMYKGSSMDEVTQNSNSAGNAENKMV